MLIKKTLQKKIERREMKKVYCIVIALMLLGQLYLFNALEGSLAYDSSISVNNHHYPVYPLLTLELNGYTQDGLQAQIKLFNESSHHWQTNYALLSKVQEDLNALTANITNLKQATIYDYNTDYIPGCIYILLSPSTLSLAGEVSNNTISFITHHTDLWWYVARVYYDVIDLNIFNVKVITHTNNHTDSIYIDPNLKNLDVFEVGFDLLNFSTVCTEYENGTKTYRIEPPDCYSIINNTIVVNYTRRDGIAATFFIYDGTNWTINIPFVRCFNDTSNLLNDQYIFKFNDVKILHGNFSYSSLQQWLNRELAFATYVGFNITPIFTENTTIFDIAEIMQLGTRCCGFSISYSSKYSFQDQFYRYTELFSAARWHDMLQLYIIIHSLFSHIWFCGNLHPGLILPSPDDYCNRSSLPLSALLLGLVTSVLVILFLKRYRKQTLTR